VTGNNDLPLRDEQIGHIQISGENVTGGYYENHAANIALFTGDGWLRTGDLGLICDGELYICGRAKEIVIVNGQNYYPHDLENIAQQVDGLELGRVAAVGIRPHGAQTDHLIFFVVHRGKVQDFLAVAEQVTRIIGEQTGILVNEVVPIKHIPRTTSGKIQRHLLAARYLDGEFDEILAQLRVQRAALRHDPMTSLQRIENKLKRICENALAGRTLGIYDNLLTLGLSSLELTELHIEIDRQYPGALELRDMVDFPTIADLARHLERRLAGRPNWLE
jgi:acyl carrier protein